MADRCRPSRAAARLAALLVALSLAGCGAGASAPAGSAVAQPAGPSGPSAVPARLPSQDWPLFGFDAQRTDAGPSTTGIDFRDVRALHMRVAPIDGIADSSAIELAGVVVRGASHDVVVVTTTYGSTIALDARTGRRLWEFRAPGVDRTPGNPQVTTATPAADPDRRFVYAAAPNGIVYKLRIATGRPVWQRAVTLDPRHEKLASALNVSGRWVDVVTGGYIGDIPPYDGHVVTIDRASGRIAHVFNTECSRRRLIILAASCSVTDTRGDDAIWGRAGAVVEPGSGRLLTATGNGPFNGSTDWGSSVLELSPDASRLLHNWTPPNQAALDHSDTDVGSTSPALGPAPGLAVQGGKDGRLHLLALARLDGTAGPAGPRLGGELDEVAAPGGGEVLTAPAVWRGWVFVGTDSGLGAYRLVVGGRPRLRSVWQQGGSATSPVIAGGLLYVYDENAGRLEIRAPTTGALLRSFDVPQGHWNSPIVAGGRVILPTGSYHDSASTSDVVILHLPGR